MIVAPPGLKEWKNSNSEIPGGSNNPFFNFGFQPHQIPSSAPIPFANVQNPTG